MLCVALAGVWILVDHLDKAFFSQHVVVDAFVLITMSQVLQSFLALFQFVDHVFPEEVEEIIGGSPASVLLVWETLLSSREEVDLRQTSFQQFIRVIIGAIEVMRRSSAV